MIRSLRTLARLIPAVLAALVLADGADDVAVRVGRGVAAGEVQPPSPVRLTTRDDHTRAFDEELRAFAGLLDLPGMVVVVAQDGKIVHQGAQKKTLVPFTAKLDQCIGQSWVKLAPEADSNAF